MQGKTVSTGQTGIFAFLRLYADVFWRAMFANLLFALLSLPVATLPAALCGLTRVCALLARGEPVQVAAEFWRGCRRVRAWTVSAALLLGGVAAYLAVGWYAACAAVHVWAALPLVLTCFAVLAGGGAGCAALVQAAAFDMRPKAAFRQGWRCFCARPLGLLAAVTLWILTGALALTQFPWGTLATAGLSCALCALVQGFASAAPGEA